MWRIGRRLLTIGATALAITACGQLAGNRVPVDANTLNTVRQLIAYRQNDCSDPPIRNNLPAPDSSLPSFDQHSSRTAPVIDWIQNNIERNPQFQPANSRPDRRQYSEDGVVHFVTVQYNSHFITLQGCLETATELRVIDQDTIDDEHSRVEFEVTGVTPSYFASLIAQTNYFVPPSPPRQSLLGQRFAVQFERRGGGDWEIQPGTFGGTGRAPNASDSYSSRPAAVAPPIQEQEARPGATSSAGIEAPEQRSNIGGTPGAELPPIERPVWIARPAPSEFANYYPRDALAAGQGARVAMDCIVQEGGALRCSVRDISDAGSYAAQFGEQSLRISTLFLMAPHLADGTSTAGRSYRLLLRWVLP